MSSDVEEYQEVVDKYYYAPEKGVIAEARKLAKIEYSKDLVKIQRNDRDDFGGFMNNLANGALQEITSSMAETIQSKLAKLHIEVYLS